MWKADKNAHKGLDYNLRENAHKGPAGDGTSPGRKPGQGMGRGFDDWMAERGEIYTSGTTKQAKIVWRLILRERGANENMNGLVR